MVPDHAGRAGAPARLAQTTSRCGWRTCTTFWRRTSGCSGLRGDPTQVVGPEKDSQQEKGKRVPPSCSRRPWPPMWPCAARRKRKEPRSSSWTKRTSGPMSSCGPSGSCGVSPPWSIRPAPGWREGHLLLGGLPGDGRSRVHGGDRHHHGRDLGHVHAAVAGATTPSP